MPIKKEKELPLQDQIMALMSCKVYVRHSAVWLDTGSPNCNKTIGSKALGLPAGKIFEIRGKKHVGKTALVMHLAAQAQEMLGAFVLWVDAENSLTNESDKPTRRFENAWAAKLGLNTESKNFYCISPKILTRKTQRKKGKKVTKAGETFVQSAEFLFKEAETVAKWVKEKWPDRPIFMGVDSIANLQTEMQVDAGDVDKNMRTALDRAMFLSGALPRWGTWAANYNIWLFLINQIRTNPNQMFGNPEYSPGGKALEHNAHVQVDMRAFKGGVIIEHDQVVGIRGKMINVKNKAGGGSTQSLRCMYEIDFSKKPNKQWKFGPLAMKDSKT